MRRAAGRSETPDGPVARLLGAISICWRRERVCVLSLAAQGYREALNWCVAISQRSSACANHSLRNQFEISALDGAGERKATARYPEDDDCWQPENPVRSCAGPESPESSPTTRPAGGRKSALGG